ncbi:hypothetical protein [Nocardia pseudobrasiliensis]|uniref:Uncharacterized protein n=1 Tax=Nocardia pseudobrasiliensis TaxID=45979 RepID=A0A370HXS8_9NOCA|nr:hypothetical protein [Nocardia pseudobrasiliensis]RDI63318.1 hypothetical protein DFR76_11015 [Nocardia pseudobrasiliensis]
MAPTKISRMTHTKGLGMRRATGRQLDGQTTARVLRNWIAARDADSKYVELINELGALVTERHARGRKLWHLDPRPSDSAQVERILADESASGARREKAASRPSSSWRGGYWQPGVSPWTGIADLDELWYLTDIIRLGEVIELGAPQRDHSKGDTKIGGYSLELSPGRLGGCYVSIPSGNDLIWDATVGYYLLIGGSLGYEAERCYALGTLDWMTAAVDWFRYTSADDAAWLLDKHRATAETGRGVVLRREITMSCEEMLTNAIGSSFPRHRSTEPLHRVCAADDVLHEFVTVRGFEFSVRHGILELAPKTSLTAATNLIVLGHDCVDAASDLRRGDPMNMVEMFGGSYPTWQSALFDCFTYYLSQCVGALRGGDATAAAGRVLLANLGWHLASPRYSKTGLVAVLTNTRDHPSPGRVYRVMDSVAPGRARVPLTECLRTLRETVLDEGIRPFPETHDSIVADTIPERIDLGRAFWRTCDTRMAEQGNPSGLWRLAGQCVLAFLENCAAAGATW